MKVAESIDQMAINPDELTTEAVIRNTFRGYKTIDDLFDQAPALPLDPIKVVKFVVYLYSEDSPLMTQPPKRFDERQFIAAKHAGFEPKDGEFKLPVKLFLFNWEDKYMFEFMFEYFSKNRSFLFQDILTLEAQMLENQKLRMRPVSEDKGKDELSAQISKDKMLKLFREQRVTLEEYYDEFYGDNEQVRTIHKLNRENMATIENFAI